MGTDNPDFSRREFIKYSAIGAGVAVTGLTGMEFANARTRTISGQIIGAAHKTGHLLRQGSFPRPDKTETIDCVIVGGGIAGLSAAWRMNKKGFKNFVLLELEAQVGGNSAGGENRTSRYPWGAHYLPLPDERLVYVRELLEELKVIKGYNTAGLPIYDEFYICAAPQERLYAFGQWQDGLFPMNGASKNDIEQFRAFMEEMNRMRDLVGNDGRHAFAIPVDESSKDPIHTALDTISMAQYMRGRGWTSEPLLWHVDYCCRDDYGCNLEDTSAWAGIHYFASRRGIGANADAHSVLTWPEGNHWMVKKMRERVSSRIRANSLVFKIDQSPGQVTVQSYDVTTGRAVAFNARKVIYAAPRFTTHHVISEFQAHPPAYISEFTYAPWMVANITLERPLHEHGVAIAWDNVIYKSESLGYVVANHQNVAPFPARKNVWTYYWPLSSEAPGLARNAALTRSHADWVQLILKDLRGAHPGIERLIENIDIWIWGHGMIRPTPGFLWGEARRIAQQPLNDQIFFAHSDMSGISIFEEAQIRGVYAADAVMKSLHGAVA